MVSGVKVSIEDVKAERKEEEGAGEVGLPIDHWSSEPFREIAMMNNMDEPFEEVEDTLYLKKNRKGCVYEVHSKFVLQI